MQAGWVGNTPVPFLQLKGAGDKGTGVVLRPGHILKQKRDLGQLGWPRSDNMTRGDLGARYWGSWAPLRIW